MMPNGAKMSGMPLEKAPPYRLAMITITLVRTSFDVLVEGTVVFENGNFNGPFGSF